MLNEIIKDINETLKFAKALDLDIIELGKKKGIDLSEAFNKDGTINEDSDVQETLRVIIKVLKEESNNQELTFGGLLTYYASKGIYLNNDTYKKNLKLITNDKYNKLAKVFGGKGV